MTYEEATEIGEEIIVFYDLVDTEEEAMEILLEATEKQIPKKVEWTEDYTWGKKTDQPVCPVCDYYLTMHHFIECSKKISYCDKCGQAIDWSSEDGR